MSCPGIDGLSRDFFEFFWDMIKVDLVDGLKEAWDDGCLLEQFQEWMIFLIPNVQGVITDARQWRQTRCSTQYIRYLPIQWPRG